MIKKSPDELFYDSVLYMAERGFFASTISRSTGLSIPQVYYRVRRAGLKIADYRRGENKNAREIITMTPCVKVQMKAEAGKPYKARFS